MPIVTLEFTQPLNASCQVGDTAYYVNTSTSEKAGHENDGFTINSTDPIEIGTIIEIKDREAAPTVKVYSTIAGWSSTQSRFIFFSKDNKANLSSPLGYFASVKLVNDSTTEAELHAVSMDIFDSSA
mgnify:FL=1